MKAKKTVKPAKPAKLTLKQRIKKLFKKGKK